jgi:hypothetical protein
MMMLAMPLSAAALAAEQADAQSAFQIKLNAHRVEFGKRLRVTGTAPSGASGQRIELEYTSRGGTAWHVIATTTVAAGGRFAFAIPKRKSGLLRALTTSSATANRASVLPTAAPAAAPGSMESQTARVAVAPEFTVRRRTLEVLGGHAADVRGRLLPGVAGRRVRLEEMEHGRWDVVSSSRTGSHGGFSIRFHAGSQAGAHGRALRVSFAGDRLNTGSASHAGRVVVFEPSVASWYEDGGATACGFHAGYGVANKSLPCGTKVTFRYGGRTVTATVDDRGPYVGGRTWDLNQNTAAALGFAGVATVWSTS